MSKQFNEYPQLLDFNTPAIALVEQNGVTYQVQVSPTLPQLLASSSVTEDALAQGCVTTTAILDGSITGSKLAPGSITGASFATGTINGTSLQTGSVPGSAITTNTITGSNIQSGSVNASALIPNTVSTLQLADGSVTSGKLAAGSVTNSIISDGSVTGGKIAPQAIQASHLQLGCITGSNIQAQSISSSSLTPDLQAFIALPLANDFNSTNNGGLFTIAATTSTIFTFTAGNTGWYNASGWINGSVSNAYYLGVTITAVSSLDPISGNAPTAPVNTIQGGYYGGAISPFVSTIVYLQSGQTLSLVGSSNQSVSVSWGLRVIQIR